MVQFSHHKSLLLIAIGIGIGIFLNFEFKWSFPIITISSIGILLVCYLRTSTQFFSASLILFISLGLGILRMQISIVNHTSSINTSGLIEIKELLSTSDFNNSYKAKLVGKPNQNLLLKISADSTLLTAGDRLSFKGSITNLNYLTYPGGFDYKKYLNKLGISQELKVDEYKLVMSGQSLKRHSLELQKIFVNQITSVIHKPREQSTALAILIGYKNPHFKSLQSTYSKAGLSHLLAISGLHTALVFSLIFMLLYPLGFLPKGKKVKWIFSIVLLWGFALISGWSHSVIRACLLLSFYVLSKLLQRSNNSFHFLILAFLINIIIDPYALFQVGFQMSYTAVFFILWMYPLLRERIKHSNQIIDKALEIIALSLSAQLGVLPLSLYYFGNLPLHFLVGNLLIVPLMGIVIYTGFLAILIPLVGTLFEQLLYYINQLVEQLSIDQLILAIKIDSFQLFCSYLLLFLLTLAIDKKSFALFKISIILAIGIQFYSISKEYQFQKKELLLIIGHYNKPQLVYKKGTSLQIYSNDSISKQTLSNLSSYFHTKNTKEYPFSNAYKIDDFSIVHIDQNSIYPSKSTTDILLLSQNPKLHLGRLIDSLKPETIIVDKSTAPWNLKRWKATAYSKKIPLIDLRSEGIYLIEFN